MRRASLIALVTLALLVFAYSGAGAALDAIGPVCLTIAPFSDFYSMFIEIFPGGNLQGVGQNLVSGAPVSLTGYVSGSSAVINLVSWTTAAAALISSATGTIDLNTGSGPGFCETVNGDLGCTTGGTPITMAFAACEF